MTKTENSKLYDLEERTYLFAKAVRELAKLLPKTIIYSDDIKQVIRSSGSVGANYIEANESLSKKDFIMRIKICRKEAKESRHWLRLFGELETKSLDQTRLDLMQEATELTNIFGSIIRKSE